MNTAEITHKLDEILSLQVGLLKAQNAAHDAGQKLADRTAKIAEADSKLALAQSIATRDLWMEFKEFHEKTIARYEESREEARNINARLSLMLTEIEFLQLKLKS